MQRKIAAFVLDHRLAITVLLLIVTAVLAFQLRLFSISQSEREDLPDNDPELLYFEQFCRRFGDAELLIVAVEADDVFTHEVLTYVKKLTDQIAAVPDVEEVVSLTNVHDVRATEEELSIKPLFETIPTSTAELAEKKKRALAGPYLAKNIISTDCRATSINAKLRYLAEDETYRIRVVKEVRRILAENTHPDINVYLTGVSPLLTDSLDCILLDLKHYMWAMPLLVILLLVFVFRTLRGAVIPQTVIAATIIWTMGLFFTAGKSVSMVTTMLPVLITVICLSDVIHTITHYYEEAARSRNRREVLLSTMDHMITACFMTSITTSIGFGSLVISDLKSVRDFGLFSAGGIMLAYILGMTITPIILSYLPLPGDATWKGYHRGYLAHLIEKIETFVARDRFWIPLTCAGLMVFAVYGVSRLNIETQISKFIPQSAPSIRGLYFIQDSMAGFTTLEMALEGEPETFKEPWALREVEEIQDFLKTLPGVDVTFSLADIIKEANQALTDGDPIHFVLPDNRRLISQLLLLLSSTGRADMLDSFLSFDYSGTRISARIQSMSTAKHLKLLSDLTQFAENNLDRRLVFQTTGVVKLYATTVTKLVNSQLRSLGFSFLVITFLMMLHIRSVKIGLLSMIPNVIPVLMTLGLMGLIGISLNVATVMISCIALGIAVDDTIHFLSRYRREIAVDGDIPAAIHRTMHSTGRAIIYTSLVIACGYSVIILSNFGPNRYFGILTAFTMLSALVADLLVLPYLIRLFKLR